MVNADPDPGQKITKFLEPSFKIKEEEKNNFKSDHNLRDKLLFFISRLEKYNFLHKKPKNVLVKLCFSLNFIPLDPDPRTQLNADPDHCIYIYY